MKIGFLMDSKSEPEAVIFPPSSSLEEVEEYFKEKCGGVMLWWIEENPKGEYSEDNRIISSVCRGKEIVRGDDGFFYYAPGDDRRLWSSHSLRVIAQFLDEKNKEYEDALNKYFTDSDTTIEF